MSLDGFTMMRPMSTSYTMIRFAEEAEQYAEKQRAIDRAKLAIDSLPIPDLPVITQEIWDALPEDERQLLRSKP